MGMPTEKLIGFMRIEYVEIVKIEEGKIRHETALSVWANKDGRLAKFAVLKPAMETFAKNTEKKKDKLIARVPAWVLLKEKEGDGVPHIEYPY